MREKFLFSHSPAEKKLYISLQKCENCSKGNLNWSTTKRKKIEDKPIDIVTTVCPECKLEKEFYFDASFFKDDPDYKKKLIINKSDNPSKIIDLVEYTNLALFHFDMLKEVITTNNKKEINYYKKSAKGCIDEALKFYRNTDVLEKDKALFSAKTLEIYKKNSKAFTPKILKLHRYKINAFCENIDSMKEIYSGLTKDKEKNKKFLKEITSKYREDKEVMKEIGRLMYTTLSDEEKERWKNLSKDIKDEIFHEGIS